MSVAGACCDRCRGVTHADTSLFARRRLLKSAVFQRQPGAGQAVADPPVAAAAVGAGNGEAGLSTGNGVPHSPRLQKASYPLPAADVAGIYRTITGTITDISPHFITIGDGQAERRYSLTADATAWRGLALEPSALYAGDDVIIRLLPSRSAVSDKVWANIGRVTGTIVHRDGDTLLVHERAGRHLPVVIAPHASERIQVKFPILQPGYLVDLIGLRHPDHLEATTPATYQPPYRSDLIPPQKPVVRLAETIAGSAVWHDNTEEPNGVLGVSYPAIDPAAGCVADAAAGFGPGLAPAYRDLPYLAVGTALQVSNECSGLKWTLPITGCAPAARLFNDHCVACRRSPRGRVADLTLASFVALGGELEAGCFYATLAIGR